MANDNFKVSRIECPNGASASSPRLARQRLPWGHRPTIHQPQRGCATSAFVSRSCDVGRNPVGVVIFSRRFPRVARASQPWALGHSLVGRWGYDQKPPRFGKAFDKSSRQSELKSLLGSVFTEQAGDFIRGGCLLRDFGSTRCSRGKHSREGSQVAGWYCPH